MSISIAIPCYNGAPYIEGCIVSAFNQSHPADKIFVIDDGSTDNSINIISKYPVEVIRHPKNLGLATARNTALHNVNTDLIVYIDADAIADHRLVEVLLQEFGRGNYAGVGGQGIEANRETVYDRWRSLHAQQSLGKERNEHCEFLAGICMGYYCNALTAIGGFDTTFRTNGEDVDIGIRLNRAGYQLVYTPEALVYHQRKDDLASLRQTMYWWYYWAFIAKKKNRRHPWTLLLGTLRRMIWSDTLPDLLLQRNLSLVKLDIELSIVKINAILSASRSDIS